MAASIAPFSKHLVVSDSSKTFSIPLILIQSEEIKVNLFACYINTVLGHRHNYILSNPHFLKFCDHFNEYLCGWLKSVWKLLTVTAVVLEFFWILCLYYLYYLMIIFYILVAGWSEYIMYRKYAGSVVNRTHAGRIWTKLYLIRAISFKSPLERWDLLGFLE